MQTIQNTVIGALEGVKDAIEQRDEQVKNREKVFSQDQKAEANQEPEGVHDANDLDKFKQIGFELLDIGLFYGQKTITQVKSLPLYQRVDSIVKFDDKFAIVKQHGTELYTVLDSKIRPIVQNVFFLYDEATKQIVSFINVITEKQNRIVEYVNTTYTSAKVTIEGQWMRLDFDHDGSVSRDDLKMSMVGLYDFLREFDVIDSAYQVKGKLYTDAIAYMQQELEQDQKTREARQQQQKEAKSAEIHNDAPVAAQALQKTE